MDKIAAAFDEAIQNKAFSGAQAIFGRGRETLYRRAFGTISHGPDARPIDDYSLFDIASLTKPVATTTLSMMSYQEGRIDLNALIYSELPAWTRHDPITIRHLLQHDSGLAAWAPIFEEARGKGWNYEQLRDFYLARIHQIPLEGLPGEKRVYSDLGFILLGFILENIEFRRLETLFWDKVALPLGMTHTMFHPTNHPERVVPQDIAATEVCPWRGRLMWGEVHDDNAHVLGGAAGHAGLFSNALDLEIFAREILEAAKGKGRVLEKKTCQAFLGDGIFPKLGWDMVSPSASQAGKYFSPKTSVGHLAFTGCSLWIDFADEKYLILLTNRVHPHRDNEAIREFRPRIHDLMVSQLFAG